MVQETAQHQHTLEQAKIVADAAIGLSAASSPLWLKLVENGLAVYMMVGGAVLLTLRIYIACREARRKPKKD